MILLSSFHTLRVRKKERKKESEVFLFDLKKVIITKINSLPSGKKFYLEHAKLSVDGNLIFPKGRINFTIILKAAFASVYLNLYF